MVRLDLNPAAKSVSPSLFQPRLKPVSDHRVSPKHIPESQVFNSEKMAYAYDKYMININYVINMHGMSEGTHLR